MGDDRWGQSRDQGPWHRRSLTLESEISWLLLLSILDILLTTWLLHRGPQFVESNPVAAWFFRRFNVAGLVGYKFAIIAAVVVIAELVERVAPGRGKFVLRLGIAAAGVVVLYSVSLHLSHPF
ncbi:DUF5658 family protein [Tautonia sociabilis]|uniref:DUF5658 domain-containing protein n=1 Tax=Tautonia sociabilis TaxID=2080755 RepID=A0A432MQ28_9BACT|nr:DUF5658 family protein [Tautonia sociabilis]RUL89581.1 hypothetical protein TsocGM_02085 [Tautonia sociabilis]